MEKVRPWCGQLSDGGRLRNRTEQYPPVGRFNFEEMKGCPIVECRDTVWSSVQKLLKRSRCRMGRGLGWAQGILH